MKSKKNVIALCLCILMLFSLACVCSASTLSENGASQQVMVADRATDSDNTLGYSNEELKSMNQFDKSSYPKQTAHMRLTRSLLTRSAHLKLRLAISPNTMAVIT